MRGVFCRVRVAFKRAKRPGLTLVRPTSSALSDAPVANARSGRSAATSPRCCDARSPDGSSAPMILRTASRSRPTIRRSLIADDGVAQRRHGHEQRRRSHTFVHAIGVRARLARRARRCRCSPARPRRPARGALASPDKTIHAASRPAPPRSNASKTISTKLRISPLPARSRMTADSIVRGQLAHHLAHQLGLQPRGRAEMMNQVRVAHAEVRRRPPAG